MVNVCLVNVCLTNVCLVYTCSFDVCLAYTCSLNVCLAYIFWAIVYLEYTSRLLVLLSESCPHFLQHSFPGTSFHYSFFVSRYLFLMCESGVYWPWPKYSVFSGRFFGSFILLYFLLMYGK